ncbi:MAG: hypothetical protein ACHQ50_10215 [Fimbriimonadales bacterium]
MANKTGYLTVYSADRNEVYGAFVDALWEIEETEGGTNHLFTGTAGEGAMETFHRIDTEGIDHVAYIFESNGYRYGGEAQLLAPTQFNGQAVVQIEIGEAPMRV